MRSLTGTWALLCVLLITQTARPSVCSLAAYSETRSFRDALEGRSMEEAISGPVDKDTSSYGDRSAGSVGASGSLQNGGQSSQASPMMLTIPANGNLMTQQQQQTNDEQEKSSNGGVEIEREAGPIDGSIADGQQQVMAEQKMMANGRQMSRAASGRLSAGRRSSRLQQDQQPQQQQQTGEDSYGGSSSSGKTNEPNGFGDEQSKTRQSMAGYNGIGAQANGMDQRQKSLEMAGQGNGYSGKQSDDSQQQQMENGNSGDQQQQTLNGSSNEQEQEKSYSNNGEDQQQEMQTNQMGGTKQPTNAKSSMYMSMNGGSGYSMNSAMNKMNGKYMKQSQMQQAGQYGSKRQQPESMAQNMIMSLANKAAYANSQKGQQQQMSQRQLAPPMMMTTQPTPSMGANYANGRTNGANGQSQMYKSSPVTGMNGMMARGGMRRANQRMSQRQMERKMSPAMMNAMLNMLLNAKQQQQQQQPETTDTAANYGMKPATMKQMTTSQPMAAMANAMAAMTPAKRDQYKRLMMAAIMQQQQQQREPENGYGMSKQDQGQQQQQSSADNYGDTKQSMSTGEDSGSRYVTPMSMANMMPAAMAKQQRSNGYGSMNKVQQSMDSTKTNGGGYGGRTASKTSMTGNEVSGYGADSTKQQQEQPEQQQRQSMDGMTMQMPYSYSQGSQRQKLPQMSPIKMMMLMNNAAKKGTNNGGYGTYAGNGDTTTPSSYSSQQEMDQPQTMMPSTGSTKGGDDSRSYSRQMGGAMNGFRQSYNQADQQQQQSEGTKGGSSSNRAESPTQAYDSTPMSMGNGDSGTKGGQSSTEYPATSSMARPMQQSPESSYDVQQSSEADQQQSTDEYGSAPMGQAEPFAFDYKIDDNYGNNQYRKEESDKNGVVRGSYGFMDTTGMYRHVEYVADENGFRANIKSNEPGLSTEPAIRAEAGSASGNRMGQPMQMNNGLNNGADTQQMVEGNGNTQAQMQIDAGNLPQQQQMYSNQQQQMSENGTK